ncbi:NAD-glutamate dehydrogenase domain-containing protein [Mycobacteroides abscessus subsp. abscessus]
MTAIQSPVLPYTAHVQEVAERLTGAPQETVRAEFLDDAGDGTIRAVIAWPTEDIALSDICTLFEHFGLRLRRQLPLGPTGAGTYLYEFTSTATPLADSLRNVAAAVQAHGTKHFTVDPFAALILAANIGWRDTVLLRALARFLKQAGLGMSHAYVIDNLAQRPRFVAALLDYFNARFDPMTADRDRAVTEAARVLDSHVEAATTVDEDRVLRAFATCFGALVRTSWFQVSESGGHKAHQAFMFDSAQLSLCGSVVPYREIFVDCDDMEGLHVRSGAIARGGLRFSDRPEDYRTEVLGLMKTQTVKNSPIVPTGAKGVFIRKNPEITVAQAYSVFINGLLDVTDNIADGKTVHPAHTVTYGADSNYLVVAADKGTAAFSDIANHIAAQRGFWLGDAFAAGGTTGYDHKQMGITARGAWVSVRDHLTEIGIDVDTEAVTVAGIGDCSGDVFGNGMLHSANLRLVAAFDHRHIFIDPDPDPAASHAERRRLHTQPGSSWADYDPNLISDGGGVWPRSAKNIVLPKPAQELLSVDRQTLTPDQLVQAVLCAKVDLLWNGGIGTYVKSHRESHVDAADPANDSVRVNAEQLRARVIGEGGNLGLTQRARVDFALRGGRVNADFIDNAAGVATSDREVNLKIALESVCRSGQLTEVQRNARLTAAENDVAATVLSGCHNQVLALGLAEAYAPRLLNRHERLIESLERHNGLNRTAEGLPSESEIAARAQDGRGLTRPEIAVLLAYSKNVVCQELLSSDIPDDPAFVSALSAYFPDSWQCGLLTDGITEHRLAREIIATQISDDLINHVGPGLIYRLEERFGVRSPEVAAIYMVTRRLFKVDSLWEHARRGGTVGAQGRWQGLHDLQQFIEHTAGRLLRHAGGRIDIAATVERYAAHIDTLRSHLQRNAPDSWLRLRRQAVDLSETAVRLGSDVRNVAQTHLALEEALGMNWVINALESHHPANWWEAMAADALRDDITDALHRLTEFPRHVDGWQPIAPERISRLKEVVARARRDGFVDVPRAAAISAELSSLCRWAGGAGG